MSYRDLPSQGNIITCRQCVVLFMVDGYCPPLPYPFKAKGRLGGYSPFLSTRSTACTDLRTPPIRVDHWRHIQYKSLDRRLRAADTDLCACHGQATSAGYSHAVRLAGGRSDRAVLPSQLPARVMTTMFYTN